MDLNVMPWIKQLSALEAAMGGAGIVAVCAALWVWFQKPDLAGLAKIGEQRGLAKGLCAWLLRNLHKVKEAAAFLTTQREWRYEQPWVLMLGEQSAGKTSLLRSVSMAERQTPPERTSQLQASGTEWVFFRKGVIIDPDGRMPAANPGSGEARDWGKTIKQLQSLRPERPMDGLILCVSARSLLGMDSASQALLAANLYRQLLQLQERIEFMLPLTVVITQCDCIGGFTSFWRSQEGSRRSELFGYSAPSQAQSFTPSQWVDDAFETLMVRLRSLQVEIAAREQKIRGADEFFLFPRHLQCLQAPLQVLLETVFRASAWQAGYLFRGMFFTGSPDADGELQAAARADVAFVDALFSRRALAEPGLARPTRTGIFSRNGLIRSLQYGSIAAAICMFTALFFAGERVSSQVETLTSALEQLKNATPDAVRHGDCLDSDAVYPLLTEVSAINHNTHYWAIPASWVDTRIDTRSDAGIEKGAIGQVLMPTLACRLENRVKELMALANRLHTPIERETFQSLRTKLRDRLQAFRELEDNLARYNALAERGRDMDRGELLDTLAQVSLYAFGTELPPEVMHERGALSEGFGKDADKPELPHQMREDFSQEVIRLSSGLRDSLHQEVVRGASMLASLNRGDTPVLDNTRRFAEWLTWTEKSWLLSSPLSSPCEEIRQSLTQDISQLVNRYAYAKSLWRELERFDKDHCFKPEMLALADLRQAPYGVIFVPRKPVGLQLAEGLRAELDGLPALVQLSFMRLKDTRAFTCVGGSEGFRQSDVVEASSYITEYEKFVQQMKLPPIGQGERPLYDKLARLSLARVLDDTMQRAQIEPASNPVQQVSFEAVTRADQQLANLSKGLSNGLNSLRTVLNRYSDYGSPSSAVLVRQCARNFAYDSLSRISALAESNRLYAPVASTGTDHMFDLGTLPIQKEYLSRQLARAQVLSGYAMPFVDLLQGTHSVNDTERSATSTEDYWRRTIDEINAYTQGKEPTGQVGNLDNYFIKQLGDLSYGGCLKQLAAYQSPAFGNDLFSERRRPLERLVEQRCSNRRVAQAMETYLALAQRFNRELAGHYPFAPASAPDARSSVVRQFFLDYVQQRATLDDAMGVLNVEKWRAAHAFVSELDTISSFFASNLLAGDGDSGAPIRLNLLFNVQTRGTSGSEQLVSWLLSSGSRAAGIPNRLSTLDWQIGESLALDLSWANRSVWAPIAESNQLDLSVDGNTATFVASQPWSVLRLIDRHKVNDSQGLVRGGLLLGFSIPQQKEPTTGKAERGRVNVYLGLRLSAADPKSQTEIKLQLPNRFPTGAPVDF